MEIKALKKKKKRYLKHCEYVLTNAKVFYWKSSKTENKIDLTSEDNKDLIERIILRQKIGEINKCINGCLASRLQKAAIDPKPYMKNYWNEIIEGFACTKNKYLTPTSFQETFLTSKESSLYRRFPDCLTAETMKNYIIYLKYYLNSLQEYGHKVAIEKTMSNFANDERMKAYYQEPALPNNWPDIYKQIKSLKTREKLLVEKADEEESSL